MDNNNIQNMMDKYFKDIHSVLNTINDKVDKIDKRVTNMEEKILFILLI